MAGLLPSPFEFSLLFVTDSIAMWLVCVDLAAIAINQTVHLMESGAYKEKERATNTIIGA